MSNLVLAPSALRDIENILAWTHETFGEETRRRYQALLFQAISRVAANPTCTGSIARPGLHASARTYHLIHSRSALRQSDRVKNPRHFLLYRLRGDEGVEISRVLHDSMDFDRHLPEGYITSDSGD